MELALWFFAVAVSVAAAAPSALENVEKTKEENKGTIWAVLVAGSSGWYNYRHQADVCHAYQILHRHGVPDSQIIVMMYDDIANNDENPKKGKIINKPNGPDVYKKVSKDWIGDKVTAENFVKVLTGEGPGKVLKSGPNDRVFINFVDHGATGIIGFPNEVMHAKDLIKALKKMHKKKMFKELVFYLEACESGSMFQRILPSNINIFATTAANPDESSYGCYCDDTTIDTCLGDEYSVAWMEDTDSAEKKGKYNAEKLLDQFKHVVKRVEKSHPQKYGQQVIDKDAVQEFLGASKKRTYAEMDSWTAGTGAHTTVSSREMALHYLNNKIRKAADTIEKNKLQKKKDELLQGRKAVDELFRAILGHVTDLNIPRVRDLETARPQLSEEMLACYKNLVDTFNTACVNISKNTYVFRHLYKLANLCLSEYSEEHVLKTFSVKCEKRHRQLLAVD